MSGLMSRSQCFSLPYLPHIDGLRAIAVLAVLLFHHFPTAVTGGFVGVDIFFVISGYLITSKIIMDIRSDGFSFAEFYFRRIRRIFPSLGLVLLSSLVFALVFFLSIELKDFGRHLISSVFFYTNFLLLSDSGYFDKSSQIKPLLHMWSLCIEEQFYILWPPILVGLWSLKRRIFLKYILGLIFSISLLMCIILTPLYPSFSFYMLPTRIWELAMGGIIAFFHYGIHQRLSFSEYIPKIDPSLFGLALILGSILYFDEAQPFPGWRALFPVLGAALIIDGDGTKGMAAKLLKMRPVVYVGLISYPLYLWHWPLISFSKIIFHQELSQSFNLILILISFLLAICTFEFFEKPIKTPGAKAVVCWSVLGGFVLLGFVGVFISRDGLPGRYLDIERINATSAAYTGSISTQEAKECRNIFIDSEMCSISHAERLPTVLLLGDSHANHLFPGLKPYYDGKGENLLLLAKSGTPPLLGLSVGNGQSLDDAMEYLKKSPSIKTVLISAFWGSYFEENGVPVADYVYFNYIRDKYSPGDKDKNKIFRSALIRTIKFLRSEGLEIVFFYDIPSLPFRLSGCYFRPLFDRHHCEFHYDSIALEQERYRSVVSQILSEFPNIKVYDPVEYLCASRTCAVMNGGVFMYSDDMHLSVEGAKKLFDHRPL